MKFKHWKEAESRGAELKVELDALDVEIAASEAEARKEDTTVERRDEILAALEGKMAERGAKQDEQAEAVSAMELLRGEEERQFGLLNSLRSDRISGRKGGAPNRDDVLESRRYELAWAKGVRTGDWGDARALVTTIDNQMLVPKTLADKIEDVMRTGGRIISLCSQVQIPGITEWPMNETKTDPGLHLETGGAPKVEKEIGFASVTMDPQFVAEILKTTDKFEADTTNVSAFWNWLMEELPDALRRVVDKLILTGAQAATACIHGILTNANPLLVATLANYELDFNVANAALAELGEGADNNVTFVMNRKTFYNNVMKLTDTTNRPIYTDVFRSNTIGATIAMGGWPVVFTDAIPAYDDAAADEAYMVAGNFKAYKLNFPMGVNVQITRDPITQMQDNIVRYLSKIYVAGNVTQLNSFVKVTKAGAAPVVPPPAEP